MKKLFKTFISLPRWQAVLFIVLVLALIVEANLILSEPDRGDVTITERDTATTSDDAIIVNAFTVGGDQGGVLTRSAVLTSETEIMLAPKIGGRLVERSVERGDTVFAGQTIARLDQDQALIAAQQNAAVNLAINQSNADRTSIIIEEDKRQAQLQLQNAQADLILKQQSLEGAQVGLTNAQNNLRNTENQNEQDLATVLQSTVEGLRSAQTTADNSLFSLSDLVNDVLSGQTLLEVTVRESYLAAQAGFGTTQIAVNSVTSTSSESEIIAALNAMIGTLEQLRVSFANASTALNDPGIDVVKTTQGIDISSAKISAAESRFSVDAGIRELSSLRDRIRTTQIVNQSRLDVAQGTLKSAEIQFSSAEQGVSLAQNNVSLAEASLRGIDARLAQQLASARSQVSIAANQLTTAQAELSKTVVTSPVSGVVAEVFADAGTLLSPGTAIVKIINPDALKLEISVSPQEAERIGSGTKVLINGSHEAVVDEVQPVADAQTRQIIVTIRVDNSANIFTPESFVEVEVSLDGEVSELTIPLSAVVIDSESTQVAAIEEGEIVWATVELGESRGTDIVVLSGLARGDKIMAINPEFLEAGQTVEISEK